MTLLQDKRLKRIAIIVGLLAVISLIAIWLLLPLPAPGEVQNRVWQLTSAESADGTVLWTAAPNTFTLEFEGYTVSGQAICNSYGGNARYVRLFNSLTIGSVYSTLMACVTADGQGLTSEAEYFQALGTVESYALLDGKLYLYFDDSAKALVFS